MNGLKTLLGPAIAEALSQRKYEQVRQALVELEPVDVAELVGSLDGADAAVVFRLLPRDLAADTFGYLESEQQQALLAQLTTERVTVIVNEMEPDDRTALLEELPAEVAQRIIALLNPHERQLTQVILGYPEESIGRLMTPDYVRVKAGWTVAQAIDHIRRYARDVETIHFIYVIDDVGLLIDDLRIGQLLLADPERTVETIMDRKFVALHATDDREEAVRQMQRYDRGALPVVDSRGMLVGIVTWDDVADVAEEEATEDIQKLGGMQALDMPYMESGFTEMVRKRAGWLALLFVGETFTLTAMGHFEEEISRAVVLALFVPLIVSSGGNSGSQATSLIIRSLAVGEIDGKHWLRVLGRELAAGLTMGAILGAIAMLRIVVWPDQQVSSAGHEVLIAVTIATSLVGVVTFGTVVGSMLPFILQRLGFDPATASAPLVATVVDVAGVTLYFTTALFLLRGTLL